MYTITTAQNSSLPASRVRTAANLYDVIDVTIRPSPVGLLAADTARAMLGSQKENLNLLSVPSANLVGSVVLQRAPTALHRDV